MKALTLAAAVTTLLLGLGVAPDAQADAARLLGSTHLTKIENDKDVLKFKECRRGINAVQLHVARGQVEIERLWVRFNNGDRDELELRERIPQGGKSRWIDVNGRERCIKAIGVVGDTELSGDQARIDIWGR